MKYQDKTDKFNACSVASKNCKLGGWCSSCMYAYPGNAAISGKPDELKEELTPEQLGALTEAFYKCYGAGKNDKRGD